MQEHILSGEEIIKLKHYIDHKHQRIHPQERASILANAVHRIIDNRLPSFPTEVKKQIRSELLMNKKELLNIEVDDVLQQCISLDLNREDILVPLSTWVCSKSTDPIEEESVRQILLGWSQEGKLAAGIQEMVSELNSIAAISNMELATTHEPAVPLQSNSWINRKIYIAGAVFFVVVMMFVLISSVKQRASIVVPYASSVDIALPSISENTQSHSTAGIPIEFRYVPVDTKLLQKYLQDKNSILAEEPFMSAIIKAGKQYDIHPLLLFAITGQEQGFVPKNHKEVERMANNPFNVFGSWESYNTTIETSANIAAKTVANVSSRRPVGASPIEWLNKTYAEDPNWWKGVSWFFNNMLQEIQDDSFNW